MHRFLACLAILCVNLTWLRADQILRPIDLTVVDEEATHFGTFQSHNQKVLSNRRGIFMTHIRSRNEPYTAQEWRLSRSTNGGKTFVTIFEAIDATNPPVIESDDSDNLYLARIDYVSGDAWLYRFAAADDYVHPVRTRLPGGGAGKFCMVLDSRRRQLYYVSHNNRFIRIGFDGAITHSVEIMAPGKHAILQYPLLSLDSDGVLHAAWTTVLPDRYLYRGIQYARSRDGGKSWETMAGRRLKLPMVADDSGGSDTISLPEEMEVNTWLSSFVAESSRGHFLYEAQFTPHRQHYVRYDLHTGKREIDITPVLRGDRLEVGGLDGLLVPGRVWSGELYCVMREPHGKRIACLVSRDAGAHWADFAVSAEVDPPYSLGGFRQLTQAGEVIGSFTSAVPGSHPPRARVYFFRIPTR